MGGRKRMASCFPFGPRCPSPRMCSTWVWSALAQLLALSTNAWRQSWSAHVSASAHARSSWTRTISNTDMYIGALVNLLAIFLLNVLFKELFQSTVLSIYLEVGLNIREEMLQSCLFYFYSITHTCKPRYGDQNHHSRFNSTKIIRRNEKKDWKLAAILDFGSHFDFFLSDCLTLEPELFHRPLPSNWYWKRNFCINLKWLSSWAPH